MIRLNANLLKQKLDYSFKLIEVNSERLEEENDKDNNERRKVARTGFG